MAPALRAARTNLLTTLRDGAKSSLRGGGRDRLRGVLVVGEIAVAVVLLVSAGLFIRSALRLQQVPLGFDTKRRAERPFGAAAGTIRSEQIRADALSPDSRDTRAVPGIRHAGASTGIPLVGGGPDASVQIEGKPFSPGTSLSPQSA